MSPRLLVCADTRPWPPDRGDRMRYAHFIDVLRADHEVRLALVRRESDARERPSPGDVDVTLSSRQVGANVARHALSMVPAQFSGFDDRGARAALRAAVGNADAFVALGARAGLYRDAFEGPAVLDLQDSLVLNARAQWRGGRGVLRRLYGADNLLKAGAFERSLVERYDLVLVAGRADHGWVRERHPRVRCELVPTAVPVPQSPADPGAEPRVLFLGDLRFAPNVDAAGYLLDEVWPRVRALHPGAILRVVGHAPAAPLARRLADAGIETAFSVPDVAPHLEAARVFLAPMRIGSGVKVKVLQAMAAGRPVVMTTLANDGVGAADDVHARVADDADGLAAGVVSLLDDPGAAREMGAAGWGLVRERFSPDAVAAVLRAALAPVLGS